MARAQSWVLNCSKDTLASAQVRRWLVTFHWLADTSQPAVVLPLPEK